MKNKRGFTLVELLVVITIIGIITVLALPGVQQLQARNRNKKYESYSGTLTSAGKLYTDSYGDDMFGMKGSGCYDIEYSELRGKSLIKDYEDKNVSCESENTFVQVIRSDNKYEFKVSLYCKNVKTGDVVYQSEPVSKCNDSSGPVGTGDVKVEVNWANLNTTDDKWSKSKDVTITASSGIGLISNVSISYGWTQDKNVRPTTLIPYNFRNTYGTLSANYKFNDNTGRNGIWYLWIEADDVIDTGGHVASGYVSEAMQFDNTPPTVPVIENPYDNKWINIDYNTKISSSDADSGIEYFEYSRDNATWTKFTNVTDEADNSKSVMSDVFNKTEDFTYYVRVCDKSSNCSTNSTKVRIDKINPTCTISKSGTSNGSFYVTPVDLILNTSDTGGSGVVTYDITRSSIPSYNNASSAVENNAPDGIIWYGYVKDTAGNVGRCQTDSFVVKATPPTITFSLSGSNSTAVCYDPDTGAEISRQTVSIASTKSHTYSCTRYGVTNTGVQKYSSKTTTHTSTGEYSCACTGCCGTCKSGYCHCCCGNCGSSTSKVTTYSTDGEPTFTTSY